MSADKGCSRGWIWKLFREPPIVREAPHSPAVRVTRGKFNDSDKTLLGWLRGCFGHGSRCRTGFGAASLRAHSAVRQHRRRGRERVAALLAAAATVFAERGYEAATMTEVAARAGASIGSLYQFFPTKELLAEGQMPNEQLGPMLAKLLAH